jgi:hypothetical protein
LLFTLYANRQGVVVGKTAAVSIKSEKKIPEGTSTLFTLSHRPATSFAHIQPLEMKQNP